MTLEGSRSTGTDAFRIGARTANGFNSPLRTSRPSEEESSCRDPTGIMIAEHRHHSNVTKKLTGRARARFEAGRDIWQEVLDGVREIKAGRGKRTSVEPRSPIVRALEIRPDTGAVRRSARSLEAYPGAMGARTARTERSGKDV